MLEMCQFCWHNFWKNTTLKQRAKYWKMGENLVKIVTEGLYYAWQRLRYSNTTVKDIIR